MQKRSVITETKIDLLREGVFLNPSIYLLHIPM